MRTHGTSGFDYKRKRDVSIAVGKADERFPSCHPFFCDIRHREIRGLIVIKDTTTNRPLMAASELNAIDR